MRTVLRNNGPNHLGWSGKVNDYLPLHDAMAIGAEALVIRKLLEVRTGYVQPKR